MELLEDLRIQTDCAFVSDLRECTKFHSIKNALNNLDVRQFTIRERNDAASYITRKALTFSKGEEASEYLKNLEEEDRQ